MNYNDPTQERIDRCVNCGESQYDEIIVATDGTVGCPVCMTECPVCFDYHDNLEVRHFEMLVNEFDKGWNKRDVCDFCISEMINNPVDYSTTMKPIRPDLFELLANNLRPE